MFGESRKPLFESIHQKLERAVPYEGGIVVVDIKPGRLQKDFLNEARAQIGDQPEAMARAERLAQNLRVFLDPKKFNKYVVETMKKREIKRPFWRMLGRVGKTTLTVDFTLEQILRASRASAMAYVVGNNAALFLNLDKIVKSAEVSEGVSSEVREAAIVQKFNSVWRHERQHFIQEASGEAFVERKREMVPKLTMEFTTTGFVIWITMFLVPSILTGGGVHMQENAPLPVLSILTAIDVASSQLIAGKLWYKLFNKIEREARLHQRKGDNLPDLFDFRFEKKS